MVDSAFLEGLGTGSYETIGTALGITPTTVAVLFIVVGIWSLIWKGLSLWKASTKKSVPWFIVLLIFNTIGILDILYIYVFSKMNLKKSSGKSKKK